MAQGVLKLTAYMVNGLTRAVAVPATSDSIKDIVFSTLESAEDITGYELYINIEDSGNIKYLKTDVHGVTEIHEKIEFRSPVEGYVVANYITSRYNV